MQLMVTRCRVRLPDTINISFGRSTSLIAEEHLFIKYGVYLAVQCNPQQCTKTKSLHYIDTGPRSVILYYLLVPFQPVKEKPKRKGPLDAIPATTDEWSSYDVPDEVLDAFNHEMMKSSGINRNTITKPVCLPISTKSFNS